MGKIKHSFTKGRMNKDLDIRLVPPGEYRDALDIQVRTSEGSAESGGTEGDSGSVQNIKNLGYLSSATTGNYFSNLNPGGGIYSDMKCVGSTVSEKDNTSYWLWTSGDDFSSVNTLPPAGGVFDDSPYQYKVDTITEVNYGGSGGSLVFVDYWGIQIALHNDDGSFSDPGGELGSQVDNNFFDSTAYDSVSVGFNSLGVEVFTNYPSGVVTQFSLNPDNNIISKFRENMTVEFFDSDDATNYASVKIKKISGNTMILYDPIDASSITWSNINWVRGTHPRVLKFDKNRIITGINVIDDLLFFTDGVNEPKKINITRSKKGSTNGIQSHTQLYVTDDDNELVLAGDLDFGADQTIINNDVLEEHVTVLRPAPKTPPTIHANARDVGELQFTISNTPFIDSTTGAPYAIGSEVLLGIDGEGNVNTSPSLSETTFLAGDEIIVTEENSLDSNLESFRVEFITYVTEGTPFDVDIPTNRIRVKIVTMPEELAITNLEWLFKIRLDKPKFELKFARFGYRYKYEDGEYSAFSPFSEIAFDPGTFDYDSVKGYNLGMVNTIRSLTIKDFIPYYTDRALDILEVDILYKSTSNANIYTVKTIKKERDPEWELFTPGPVSGVDTIGTGELELKSDTIHKVVAANQLLRNFDNVPRKALAQEITASRVLYGNFTQGFDITKPVSLSQLITSQEVGSQPERSVKTLRDYKVGMVFGDKYGRETPVIESSSVTGTAELGYSAISNDLYVDKSFCALANKIKVQQSWDNPLSNNNPLDSMDWMSYVKYYIKETSNEYYNLVLDRWYYARNQDNIWLSFPSADRNKVDLETYLILKKSHGEPAVPVLDEARYKIIDIDNEAPDFIKIDHRKMGVLKLGQGTHVNGTDEPNFDNIGLFTDTTLSPNISEPNRLTDPDTTEIIIPATFANGDDGGFLDNYGLTQRGQLKVRVVGRTIVLNGTTDTFVNELNSGDFLKVNHFYKKNNGDLVITIEKSFGDTANMLQAFINADYPINNEAGNLNDPNSGNDLQYFLEFKEEVVENKPEFDGRFFVLIEKDFSIEEHVEKFSGAFVNFVPTFEFKIGYIDTQQKNPAESGPFAEGGTDAAGNPGNVYPGTTAGWSDADPTAPHEWWGWGKIPLDVSQRTPLVNFFAMGCHTNNNGYVASDTGGQAFGLLKHTREYWEEHKEWHSDENLNTDGFNTGKDTVDGNFHRVFLDGARAHRFQLNEFNENGEGYDPGAEFNTTIVGNAPHRNDDDLYNTGGEDMGVSMFNYKPTALDQGGAEDGTMGRMIWSKQNSGTQAADSNWGGGGQNIFDAITEEGTYFQFKRDRSNITDPNFPEGKPHVYQIIHRDVEDPSILIPPDRSTGVKNYGLYDEDNNDEPYFEGSTDNLISTTTTFGNDNECGIFSGTFGGENSIWNSGTWVSDLIASIGTDPFVDANADIITFDVRTSANGDECLQNKHKKQRTCGKCKNADEYCQRTSVRFEFRKINPLTGELTNLGMEDLDVFDPRGHAKHDGTVGNIEIQILKRTNNPEEIIVPEADRAVWETEPKEGTELDIYYEATHALPMKLNQGNTLAFAPLNSKVGLLNSNSSGVTVSQSFTETAFVSNVHYTSDSSIIEISKGSPPSLLVEGISIGSLITFTHKSGLVTRAVVEDFYKFDTNNVTLIPQTGSVTVAITLNEAGTSVSFNSVEAGVLGGLLDLSSFSFGMSITAESSLFTVPSGIFIQDLPGDSGNAEGIVLNDMSWLTPGETFSFSFDVGGGVLANIPAALTFTQPTGYYKINSNVYTQPVELGWHNCYSFGNGVESDRIRDDFNAPQIDNGVKVSATVDNFGEENKASSLIFSGLYNTTSGVNDLNEFNMGEKIIKDLNPEYGSVQALKTRALAGSTDVVVLCEDRILKVLSNKDAVFNADGNPQLVATNAVLGQVSTFVGEYGVSKNPESVASDQYRLYFTDKQRGAVLRLSMDGLTPISNVGMKQFFRTYLGNASSTDKFIGSFDQVNGEYNLTFDQDLPDESGPTISFNEASKGWVSFKSFKPDQAVSVSGKYFSCDGPLLRLHYHPFSNGYLSPCSIDVVFNDMPSSVKSFKSIVYEGTQGRVNMTNNSSTDSEYQKQEIANNFLFQKFGWQVKSFVTDLTNTDASRLYHVPEFVKREGKWFNRISNKYGAIINPLTVDSDLFTVQGIGKPTSVVNPDDVPLPETYTFTIENDTNDDPNTAGQDSSGNYY